jgi:uncharacterized protein
MINLNKVRAIDFHTHAEEPCGCHADVGYDNLQATMANAFAPRSHPPTEKLAIGATRTKNSLNWPPRTATC